VKWKHHDQSEISSDGKTETYFLAKFEELHPMELVITNIL
jgi:hypothetical protein